MSRLRTARFVLLSLATVAIAPLALAQSGDADENARLQAKGQEMLQQLLEGREEALQLRADAQSASGEDERILRRRLAEVQLDLLDDLGDVVRNVLQQEQAQLDTTTIRAQLDPLMTGIGARGPEVAQEQLARLRTMRETIETDPPANLELFEEKFNKESDWLDTIHRACLEHYERMGSLGLDGSALRAFLEQSLAAGADSLAGRLELSAEDAKSIRARLVDVPTDETLQTRLRVAETRIEGTARSLSENVAMMKRLELPTTRYQQVLIQATGDITTDVLDTRVALGLLQNWVGSGKDWLIDNGPDVAFRVLVFVAVLALFWFLSRFVRRVVRRSIKSSNLKLSQLMQDMVVGFSGKLVFLLGLLLALSQIGVSLGPVLAGLGIAGFIVGFALQDTLGNFASGMMILIYRPFDVGDLIEAAGAFGTVKNMNLVSTTILTIDNQTLVVPNNKIWGDVIKNVTSQKIRRVDMTFGISYTDDIPKTEKLLSEILQAHPQILDDPEPVVRLHNLGDSSVDFVVRPWVNTDDYWDVYWFVTREVKMRFDAEGVSIPFPQRDVHLYQEQP